ncbi:MAG: cupin domain-containing protein [Acidobacteriota bacterium]
MPDLDTQTPPVRDKVNLAEAFGGFDDRWSPKIAAELNGQLVKLAKVEGEFVWHAHADEDEMFLVVKGEMTLRLRDREVHLREGEFFVVPRGVEHQPVASEEAHILLFEPKATAHTGEVDDPLTVAVDDQLWI